MPKKGDPLLNYIAAVEGVNQQLVETLSFWVQLLTEFKAQVPDPEEWQEMLDAFALILHEAEHAPEKKTMH